jgi:hypothetical protein
MLVSRPPEQVRLYKFDEFKRAFGTAVLQNSSDFPIEIYIYCLKNRKKIDELLSPIIHIPQVAQFRKNLYPFIIKNKIKIMPYITETSLLLNTHLYNFAIENVSIENFPSVLYNLWTEEKIFFDNKKLTFTFIIKEDDKVIKKIHHHFILFTLITKYGDDDVKKSVERNNIFFNVDKIINSLKNNDQLYIFDCQITELNREMIIEEFIKLKEKCKDIFTNFGRLKFFHLCKNYVLLRCQDSDVVKEDVTSLSQDFEYTI